MRSKTITVLILTVFFLSLPFACGLFFSKTNEATVFENKDYKVTKDITVKIYDAETKQIKDGSLADCIYRQIVSDGADRLCDEAVKAVACAVCSDMLLRLEISLRGGERVCLDFTPAQLLRIETREIKD